MNCITLGVAKSQTRLSLSLCLDGSLSQTNLSFCLLFLLLHMIILLLALQGILPTMKPSLILLQERGPLPGPERGLLSNTGK